MLSALVVCSGILLTAAGCSDHSVSGVPSAVTVTPSAASVEVGGVVKLTAEIDGKAGRPSWTSSQTSVATVDTSGAVTGRAAGVVTITASSNGGTATAQVTVIEFGAVVRGIRPRGYAAVPYVLLSPPSGSTAYYVSPSGNDGNAGTSASPFLTINHAAQVAGAGDVVTIRAGQYRESVIVRNSGTRQKPIVFQAEQRGGVVLTGGTYKFEPAGWTGGKMASGPLYVTVRGLIFRAYARIDDTSNTAAAAKAATGWTYEDCLFDSAGRWGLDIRGDSVTVVRSTFQYNYQHAFTAWGPTTGAVGPDDPKFVGIEGLRVIDVVVRGNYTSNEVMSSALSSRIVKFLGTKGTLVDNMESYENWGPGLWLDYANAKYTIRNSYFHDNRYKGTGQSPGRGLHLEVDWSPGLVENNVFYHNTDEAIALNNSQGVEVRYNLMVDHTQCIRMYNGDRGSSFVLKDLNIHDNFCKRWSSNGAIQAIYGTFTTPDQMNIKLDGNAYDPGASDWLTWWPGVGSVATIEGMQRLLGWEARGRVAAIRWPP